MGQPCRAARPLLLSGRRKLPVRCRPIADVRQCRRQTSAIGARRGAGGSELTPLLTRGSASLLLVYLLVFRKSLKILLCDIIRLIYEFGAGQGTILMFANVANIRNRPRNPECQGVQRSGRSLLSPLVRWQPRILLMRKLLTTPARVVLALPLAACARTKDLALLARCVADVGRTDRHEARAIALSSPRASLW